MSSTGRPRTYGHRLRRWGVLGLCLLLLLGAGPVLPLAFAAASPAPLPGQAPVYRLVVNVTTGAPLGPLPGAAVYLDGSYRGVTSLNGTLSLGTLPPANYTVEVEAQRYAPVNVSLALDAPTELPVHLNSLATPGVLTGSYTPAAATFVIVPYPPVPPTQSNSTTTRFRLLLPPGLYNYSLTYHGEIQRGSFLIDPGKTLSLVLSLPPASPGNAAGSPWTNPYVETGLALLGMALGIGLVLGVAGYRRRKARSRTPPPGGQP